MECYEFKSWEELMTFMQDRGPMRQFQAVFLDRDENEDLESVWSITVQGGSTSLATLPPQAG
jgi:hypothetical protein